MATFDICFPFCLENEAGPTANYNAVPDAPPGSQAIAGVNSHYFPADFAQIAALPIEERPAAVAAFYEHRFWSDWLAQIASNKLAAMVMDSGINQGGGTATRILQTAINTQSEGQPMLAEDGLWGPMTIYRVNALGVALIPAWIQARVAKYEEKQRDPNTQAALTARARKIPNFD